MSRACSPTGSSRPSATRWTGKRSIVVSKAVIGPAAAMLPVIFYAGGFVKKILFALVMILPGLVHAQNAVSVGVWTSTGCPAGSPVPCWVPTSSSNPLPISMSGAGPGGSTDVTITGPLDSSGNVSVTTVPLGEASTNLSGSITAGGAWQQLNATAGRRFALQNPCTTASEGIGATESVFIQFSATTPTSTASAWEIPSCAIFDSGASLVVSDTGPIWVYAATTGHLFTSKLWP